MAGREEFRAFTPDVQPVILGAAGFTLNQALDQDSTLAMAESLPRPFFPMPAQFHRCLRYPQGSLIGEPRLNSVLAGPVTARRSTHRGFRRAFDHHDVTTILQNDRHRVRNRLGQRRRRLRRRHHVAVTSDDQRRTGHLAAASSASLKTSQAAISMPSTSPGARASAIARHLHPHARRLVETEMSRFAETPRYDQIPGCGIVGFRRGQQIRMHRHHGADA